MWLAMDNHRGRFGSWQGGAGFTMAEVLIVTAISGVILLGLYLMYDVNQVTFVKGEQQADLQQNARIVMDRIVRELRLAGSERQTPPVIPASCTTAIQLAEATRINFIANIDDDDLTERVEYTYDGASSPPNIKREQWPSFTGPGCASWSASGGAQSFAERVTTVAFTYYDGNNACLGGAAAPDCPAPPVPTINLGNIRRISITITTQDAQIGSTAQPFTLRAEVRPRNLGL
jgi:prepilin-type N-terminal cleavage/methylation domain-containing protein